MLQLYSLLLRDSSHSLLCIHLACCKSWSISRRRAEASCEHWVPGSGGLLPLLWKEAAPQLPGDWHLTVINMSESGPKLKSKIERSCGGKPTAKDFFQKRRDITSFARKLQLCELQTIASRLQREHAGNDANCKRLRAPAGQERRKEGFCKKRGGRVQVRGS